MKRLAPQLPTKVAPKLVIDWRKSQRAHLQLRSVAPAWDVASAAAQHARAIVVGHHDARRRLGRPE
ncbi:hypothetical protein [Sorangium sp. So ce693]|uniref:hypothetical protein n=1 Tax=Sorangium sp. So ce693 TaxID=3133318 RepID=UPI003F60BA2C